MTQIASPDISQSHLERVLNARDDGVRSIPLTLTEQWYYRLDSVAPLNCGFLVTLRGLVEADRLKHIVDRWAEVYTMFRWRLCDVGDELCFVDSGSAPEFNFESIHGDRLQERCDAILNEPIGADRQTCKVYLFHSLDSAQVEQSLSYVLVVMSHLVVDGVGGQRATRDLLAMALTDQPLNNSDFSDAAMDEYLIRLPVSKRALGVVSGQLTSLWQAVVEKPFRIESEKPVSLRGRKTFFRTFSIPEAKWRLIQEQVASNGGSVHGYFCQLLATAVAEIYDVANRNIGIGNVLDMRNHLNAGGNHARPYVSALLTCHEPGREFLFKRSGQFRKTFRKILGRNEHIGALQLLRWVVGSRWFNPEKFLSLVEKRAPGNITVSDLSKEVFPGRFGSFDVLSIHLMPAASLSGNLVMTCCRIGDGMDITLCGVDPIIDRKRLSAISEIVKELVTLDS